MEWLTNPWVIGIGTAVIAGLILYYVFGIGKAKLRKQTPNHPVEENVNSDIPAVQEKSVVSILAEEIIEHLDSIPPLQRESAAKNYEGIKVSWEVTLKSGFTTPFGEKPFITMRDKLGHSIVCSVDLNQYPEFRVMKEGHQFRIEGEIDSVQRVGDVALKNCRFHF